MLRFIIVGFGFCIIGSTILYFAHILLDGGSK